MTAMKTKMSDADTLDKIRVMTQCPAGADLLAHIERLTAESVQLRSGPQGFFCYDSDSGYEEFPTMEKAIEAADAAIDYYRGEACDGWSEETDRVCWGIVMQKATMTDEREATKEDCLADHIEKFCDYVLLPQLQHAALDAIYARNVVSGIDLVTAHYHSLKRQASYDGNTVEVKRLHVLLGELYAFRRTIRKAGDTLLTQVREQVVEDLWMTSLCDMACCMWEVGMFDKAEDRNDARDMLHDELAERLGDFAASLSKLPELETANQLEKMN